MLRRRFLTQLAASVASAGFGANAWAYTKKRHTLSGPPPKLDRIAVSSWSLHNYFQGTREADCSLSGPMLALLDFPGMVTDRYHVHHFEISASHFPSTEPAYLQELKYALVHTRSTVVNLLIDIEECGAQGTFSDSDRELRTAALEAVTHWVDVAHRLGVKSVRVGPGKVNLAGLAPAVDSYKALASYAVPRGVHVLVENRVGFGAEHPEELVKVLKLVGPGRIGVLPDFANFADEAAREQGLKLLIPYAQNVCHAKGLEFDATGTEQGYDFPQAMEIAKQAGFRGIYSIEFIGAGDPYAGIQKTLDEVMKYL